MFGPTFPKDSWDALFRVLKNLPNTQSDISQALAEFAISKLECARDEVDTMANRNRERSRVHRILVKLDLPGIGHGTMEALAARIPSEDKLYTMSPRDFTMMPGIGSGKANMIYNALHEQTRRSRS